MENWDELRTAYEVVRHGTVSGAAGALGVHHATVIRHVDALEARLGVKLFQRHARGYAPTEAGEELARVARASDDQFSQLAARLAGGSAEVTGDLVITTLAAFAPRLLPVLARFQADHPGVILHLRTGRRLFRLEYGEAHVAIRAGRAPEEPDNVVQPFEKLDMALYAAPSYIEQFGRPETLADLDNHRIVTFGVPVPQYLKNLNSLEVAGRSADNPRVPILRINNLLSIKNAITKGIGIAILPDYMVGKESGLERLVLPEAEVPGFSTYFVYPAELKNSARVNVFRDFLVSKAQNWPF